MKNIFYLFFKRFVMVAFFSLFLIGFLFSAQHIYAVDGSGSAVVAPGSANAGSTGGTYVFTFTAAEAMNSGEVSISTAPGWSAMQGVSGTAGYTTVASTGLTANVEDNADSLSGWSAGTACLNGLSSDTLNYHEGLGSILCSTGDQNTGQVFYKNISSQNWSSYTKVGFWIKVGKNISSGNLRFLYDDNNNLASPIARINLPAITANTWTFVNLSLSGTRTSVLSYGFEINNNTNLDNTTINIDDILLGPGSPVFVNGIAHVRLLTLSSGQTVTFNYGFGGGTSGASAPLVGQVSTFSTQTRTSDSGVLTNISTSPKITVNNPVPAILSVSPTSTIAGGTQFTLTVNGSNFNASSSVNWNSSPRVTNYISSNQLSATILSSDIANEGTSTVTVVNPTPGGGTSNGATVTSIAIAVKFVILPPGNGTVDASVPVTVQAQKNDGSVDPNFNKGVTLNVNGSATGGGLLSFASGVATTSISDHVAQTVLLSLTDSQSTGLISTSTQEIIFSPGAITQFSLNNPGNMYANTRLGYTVTRKDQYSNPVSASTSTVYLYTSSTSTNHGFYNDPLIGSYLNFISIPDGSANASFWYYETVPGNYLITASDNSSAPDGAAGIADATSSVEVMPVATKFVIMPTTSTTVDNPITVTIQAQKPDGTVDVNYQKGVTLVVNGSATGGGLVTIVNGVGTMKISDTVPETVHLSLSDTQSTGLDVSSYQDVYFGVGATAQFVLSHPVSMGAGTRAAYTITRKDQFGNLTTNGTGTAYLYSSSPSLNKKFYDSATAGNVITSIQFPNGQSSANFWYYDDTLGTWTITGSDNASSPDGSVGIQDAVDSIIVNPGPVASFSLNNPGGMSVGTYLEYSVTRKDQFGNLVTSGITPVYLYSSANDTSTGFYLSSGGGTPIKSVSISDSSSTANFWYYENVPGNYTLTASDNSSAPDGATGIADATVSVNVMAAPIVATKFVILPTATGTVDSPITVTIEAQDNSGNIDTSATSSVTLVVGGSATGGGLVTMVNGIGTASVSDHKAETVTLSLSDTQGTGLNVSSVQNAIFNPGAVYQFTLDNPGAMAAGVRQQFTATRKDKYGNLVTSGSNSVYLYSASIGTYHFYNASSGGSSINSLVITDGYSSAPFWYYDEKAATTTITISDNSSSPDGPIGIVDASQTIIVQPGPVYKFILDNPGNMTAGTRLGYSLTRQDQFNNPVISGVLTAYLYTSSVGATTTAFYDAASGGGSETFVVFNNNVSSVQFWYFDESPGTWVITASDGTPTPNGTSGIQDAAVSVTVTLAPIVATRVNIMPVGDTLVGQNALVTVKAQDDSGNTDTLYNGNVLLSVSGSASGGGQINIVNGIGTISIHDSVAEIVNLSLSSSSSGLITSSAQTIRFYTSSGPAFYGGGSVAMPIIPVITGVQFSGTAFTGAKLNIISIGNAGDVPVKQQTVASASGSFNILFSNIQSGARSYGIVAYDSSNRPTQTKIFDANLANSNQLLKISNVLLSPTLGLIRTSITRGDNLGLIGSATAGNKIEVEIDGNISTSSSATADSKGNYKILINTASLDFGSHTVRVRQVTSGGTKSDFSPQQVFSITKVFTPNMDFNNDGVIDIKDWSIFISRWTSTDPKVRALDDLNGDGKVDVQDFSIFVRTLKQQ